MIMLGGLTYFVVFWFVSRETLLQGLAIIRSTLDRKKPSPKTILEGASND
jgi:hypothetical protein